MFTKRLGFCAWIRGAIISTKKLKCHLQLELLQFVPPLIKIACSDNVSNNEEAFPVIEQNFWLMRVITIGDLLLEYSLVVEIVSLYYCLFVFFVATIYSSEIAKLNGNKSSDLHPLTNSCKVDFIRMDYNLDSTCIFKNKTTNKWKCIRGYIMS